MIYEYMWIKTCISFETDIKRVTCNHCGYYISIIIIIIIIIII